jgi:hypothetical protein
VSKNESLEQIKQRIAQALGFSCQGARLWRFEYTFAPAIEKISDNLVKQITQQKFNQEPLVDLETAKGTI